MKRNVIVLAAVALAGACAEAPTSPTELVLHSVSSSQRNERGTGLVIDNLTEVSLPLIGQVGEVVTEDFLTEVHVASSGPGQCNDLTVDLGPVALEALGGLVSVDAPQVNVAPKASGALGPLLCALGNALQPAVSGVTSAVRGLVNAINAVLI